MAKRWLRFAIPAGLAGAFVGGVAVGGRILLVRQAAVARGIIGQPHGEDAPAADRTYKKRYGDRIELLVVGDSIAAGLGAETPRDTLGARLARGVAKKVHRSVRLRTVARVGAEASMLAGQLDTLPTGYRPHVAVIIVGGNDVTHRTPLADCTRDLRAAIDRLHDLGTVVVVGTCPDLGALRPVPQPLRALGAVASRQMAAAQREVVTEAGAHAVSLADVVGPFFITNPDEMFSLDRFHPSSQGYKRTAKALLPSLLHALGYDDRVPFGHAVPAG